MHDGHQHIATVTHTDGDVHVRAEHFDDDGAPVRLVAVEMGTDESGPVFIPAATAHTVAAAIMAGADQLHT